MKKTTKKTVQKVLKKFELVDRTDGLVMENKIMKKVGYIQTEED